MSRKDKNFAKAVWYVSRKRDRGGQDLLYPFDAWSENPTNKELIEKFVDNAKDCPDRKGGNYFYHAVISCHHLDRELATTDIMLDMAYKAIELMAPQSLAYGQVHSDTKCPHIHLIISANALGNSKKIRLSKKEFDRAKRELEAYQREHYPFLENSIVFDRKKRRQKDFKQKQREREREQRLEREGSREKVVGSRNLSEKEKTCGIVKNSLETAVSEKEFKEKLMAAGLKFYQRGKKTFGVQRLDGKGKYKKFRLKTLGLAELLEKTAVYWKNRPQMEEELRQARERSLRLGKTPSLSLELPDL